MDIGTHLPMYFHFGKANDWLSLKGFLSQLLAGGGGPGKMMKIICVNAPEWTSASSSWTFTACQSV